MAVLAEPAVSLSGFELAALNAVAGTIVREFLAGLPVADQLAGRGIPDRGARKLYDFGSLFLRELGFPDLAAELL